MFTSTASTSITPRYSQGVRRLLSRLSVLAVLCAACAACVGVTLAPTVMAAPNSPQQALQRTTPQSTNVFTLDEESIDGPALWTVAAGGEQSALAVLAWTGTDPAHSLNVMTSSDGVHFSNKITLDEQSFTRPSVLVTQVGTASIVVLAWTGTDANHSLNVLYDAYGTRRKITLDDSSNYAPSLALYQGQVLLAWTGTDSNHSLNVKQMGEQGLTNGTKTILSQYSSDAQPAIFSDVHNGQVLLSWSYNSAPNWINFATASDGVHFTTPLVAPPPQTSKMAPNMITVSPMPQNTMYPYYWAWTGTDPLHSLNLTATSTLNNWPKPIVTLDEQATGGPALGYVGTPNQLLIAWTGIDSAHHLNIMIINTKTLP